VGRDEEVFFMKELAKGISRVYTEMLTSLPPGYGFKMVKDSGGRSLTVYFSMSLKEDSQS